MKLRSLWFLLLLFFVPSCLLTPSSCTKSIPVPAAPAAAPLGVAQGERESKASAYVAAGRLANASNPDGNPKSTVEGTLGVAAANLGAATDKDQAEANASVAKGLAGNLKDAQAGWDKARGEAAALQTRIDGLTKQLADQQAQAVLDRQKLDDAHAKEMQDLKDAHSKALQAWAARILIGVGIAGLVACGFAIFSSGLAALPKAGLGAIASLLFIGAGIIVGQTWFLWVVGAALLLGVIAAIWYAVHMHKTTAIANGLARRDQDLKDAAAEGNADAKAAVATLQTHTDYRLAPPLQHTIDQRLQTEGVNAK